MIMECAVNTAVNNIALPDSEQKRSYSWCCCGSSFAFNLSIGIAVASTYDYKYGFALISDAGDVTRKRGKGKILQYCELFPRTTRYLRTMSRKVAGTDKIKRHYSGRTADKCCNHYLRSCEFSINTLPEGGWH